MIDSAAAIVRPLALTVGLLPLPWEGGVVTDVTTCRCHTVRRGPQVRHDATQTAELASGGGALA